MTRRHAVPLLILALLVAGLAVMQRGVEIRAPESPGIDPFELVRRAHPPRARSAERPATPAPRSVRVAVTSMDGTPIPGARVELVPGPGLFLDRWLFPSAEVPGPARTADAADDGTAQFDDVAPGRWFVVAEASGFARHAVPGVTVAGTGPGVDLGVALSAGHPFGGKILDADGAPAAGITVVLSPRSEFVTDGICLRTTTAKDGTYRFEKVEPGQHDFWYAPRDGVFKEEARVLVPSLDRLDIQIVRGATIEGTVVDADLGRPVPGARVLALGRRVFSRAADTSADEPQTVMFDAVRADRVGRFQLQTWRRTCDRVSLCVDAEGYATEPVDAPGRTSLDAPVSDGQRFAIDLRVRRCGSVTGQLRTPEGPLAGLVVTAHPPLLFPGCRPRACVTGADGRFRIDGLAPDGAVLGVLDPRSQVFVFPESDVPIEPAHEATCDIDLSVRHLHLSRVVVDERGEPLADVTVEERLGSLHVAARSDAEGRVEIDAVVLGESELPFVLRCDGFRDEFVRVARDGDHEPTWQMTRAQDATGVVAGPDATPVAGVRLRLVPYAPAAEWFPSWDGARETVSGADGSFRVADGAGRLRWLYVPGGEEIYWIGGYLSVSDSSPASIEMPENVRIRGRVVEAGTDRPVPDARVVVREFLVVGCTGADGRFDGYVPKPVSDVVTITADGWNSAGVRRGDGEARVELVRALRIGGVLKRADGKQVVDAVVRATPRGTTNGAEDERYASAVDRDGRFVLSGLLKNDWDLTVAGPDHDAITCSRVSAESGSEDVVVTAYSAVPLVVDVVAEGEPNAFVRLTAHPESGDLADVTERVWREGSTTFALAPDVAYTIFVDREGFHPVTKSGVRADDGRLRIELVRDTTR